MTYQVIARKYRPQTFSEIVGQTVAVRTLQNAIRRARTSHAYLFSGPRGVGKTTMARILAKALNCKTGPTPDPCGQCPACSEVTQGNALDVIEIDAASNRGIDEVRELRDSIQYGPARDRFKVFIVDEAHMLTNEAFNALLKTLEEPPSHVVFMLATTEKHKVPVTIVSRCQSFDFQLISTPQIVDRLKSVTRSETLTISDRAIEQIAVAGEGSLRDALSLLDQVINYGGTELSDEDVAAILGELDISILQRLSAAVSSGNGKEILEIVGHVCESGYDVQHFCRRLLQHFRNMLVNRAAGSDPRLLNLPVSQVQVVSQSAEGFSPEDLVRCLEVLSKTETDMRFAYYPRFNLELALLKLSYLPRLTSLSQLILDLRAAGTMDTDSGETANAEPSLSKERLVPPNASPRDTTPAGRDPRIARFFHAVKERDPVTCSWLDMAQSVEFQDGVLNVFFERKYAFQHEKLSDAESTELLHLITREVFGEPINLSLTLEDRPARIEIQAEPFDAVRRRDDAVLNSVKEEPILRSFLETFPGKVSVEEKEP